MSLTTLLNLVSFHDSTITNVRCTESRVVVTVEQCSCCQPWVDIESDEDPPTITLEIALEEVEISGGPPLPVPFSITGNGECDGEVMGDPKVSLSVDGRETYTFALALTDFTNHEDGYPMIRYYAVQLSTTQSAWMVLTGEIPAL